MLYYYEMNIPDSSQHTGHPDKRQQSDRSEHRQNGKQNNQFHN